MALVVILTWCHLSLTVRVLPKIGTEDLRTFLWTSRLMMIIRRALSIKVMILEMTLWMRVMKWIVWTRMFSGMEDSWISRPRFQKKA